MLTHAHNMSMCFLLGPLALFIATICSHRFEMMLKQLHTASVNVLYYVMKCCWCQFWRKKKNRNICRNSACKMHILFLQYLKQNLPEMCFIFLAGIKNQLTPPLQKSKY